MAPSARVTSVDYRHPHRPLPVAGINRLARALAPLGRQAAPLTPAALLGAARRRTGLHAADSPPALAPALERLLRAVEQEARLTFTGRLMARANLVRVLSVRLRLEAAFAADPQLEARELAPPIFIVGLQRTGTTLLHRLLCCDPQLRYLRSWEAINPLPVSWPAPLRPLQRAGLEPRILPALLAERALSYLAPDFFAIHPVQALAPEEDCLLLDYTLWSTVFEATQWVPSYSRWLEAQPDHGPAYAFYRRVLQLLEQQRPGRWVLKTPHHMEQLDALLSVFPGARVVMTHRDPVKALASFCSMMAHGYGVFSDEVDPLAVGDHWSRKAHRMVQRAMASRAALGQAESEHFLDVRYPELVADPLAQVQRIYRWVGLELSPATEEAMRSFLATNPQHKHGRHRYQLQDFGLDPRKEERQFEPYRERFNVAYER